MFSKFKPWLSISVI